MTRHTPDFLRARSSQLSLRSLALEQSIASRNEAVTDAPDNTIDAMDLRPEAFTKPYCNFMTENPTVFHAVGYFKEKLLKAGYEEVRRRVCTTMVNVLILVRNSSQVEKIGQESSLLAANTSLLAMAAPSLAFRWGRPTSLAMAWL